MSAVPVGGRLSTEHSRELSNQWRALRRAATGVALLTSPALFVWLYKMQEVTLAWALVGQDRLVLPADHLRRLRGAGAQVRHRRRELRRLGTGHLALADLEAPPE